MHPSKLGKYTEIRTVIAVIIELLTPKHQAADTLKNAYIHMSDAVCLAPFGASSLHLRRLLRRNFGLHLPPRRQNHLIPSSL